MAVIVDPTNEDIALVDGEVASAIYLITPREGFDPYRPTVADLDMASAVRVGYGNLTFE